MRSAARRSGLRAALAPHWGALLALALFLIAGLAVLDDYGVTVDESPHRAIWPRVLRYIQGDYGVLAVGHERFHERFYGGALQVPLLLAERSFGLDDSRAVYLARHLITYLIFLAGGLFAYFLAFRLFGARLLALFAMLLFLLHPRLYAHSFFNAYDVPFLALFMIALFLAHRAFSRNTLPAFVLLGVGVGALLNLRIMGVVLLAAVPSMRALDLALAGGQAERKRVVLTTGAFALASGLTAYALLPYLWADPVGRTIEWWTFSSAQLVVVVELFRGTVYPSVEFPADYLPVWFSITSPPFALLLGAVGAAAVLAGAVRAPMGAVRNTRLRFGLLALGCAAAPALAVIALDVDVYNGWRQLYFLWAPFSLLALFGLRQLASALRRAPLRAGAYGAACAGLAAALISMALLHPNQQAFFNFFADRTTPGHLGGQYTVDYWRAPVRQALERLLDRDPAAQVNVNLSGFDYMVKRNAEILPEAARNRISTAPDADALTFAYGPAADEALELYTLSVYGSAIMSVSRKADLRAAYAASKTSAPIIRADFDIYHIDGALVFVRETCGEDDAVDSRFRLRVVPERALDLPAMWARLGYEDRSFRFPGYGAVVDGKCVASVPLPRYSVGVVRIEQWAPVGGTNLSTTLWESTVALNPDAWRARWRAAVSGEPVARAAFGLYLDGGALVYAKQPCSPEDTATRFFLHITPERAGDLPRERRGHGFDNLGFEFFLRGGHFDGKCLARVPLPDYPITSIRTGQYVSGVGEIWSEEFSIGG